MLKRQELHCHNCNNYVQFEVDIELNGNHVLKCPSCDHEHCRVVRDGEITDDRWDSRNQTFNVSGTMSYTANSTWTAYNNSTNVTYQINTLYQASNTANTITFNQTRDSSGKAIIYSSWMDLTCS